MGADLLTWLRRQVFRHPKEVPVGSEAQVIALLVKKYGVDEQKVSPDATMADLGLDSLSVAELVFDIEDEFGIEVKVEDANFATLGEAIALVDRYIEAKGS